MHPVFFAKDQILILIGLPNFQFLRTLRNIVSLAHDADNFQYPHRYQDASIALPSPEKMCAIPHRRVPKIFAAYQE